MRIRFLGVRGSIPSPGEATLRTGGNTSSVEVCCGERRIVLDAGTGIRRLGDELIRSGAVDITLLFSHLHWDHIQGLPFFAPIYRKGTLLDLYGPAATGAALSSAFEHQMGAPGFPVRWQDLPSQAACTPLSGGETFWIDDVKISCAELNHPGGVLGYRIDYRGRSVVYATDTEHLADPDQALLTLCEGADVLIYDAMYTEAEYRGERGAPRIGWGHSTWEAGVRVAKQAHVGQLVLFHHDPSRSDAQVEALEAAACAELPGTIAAREEHILTLGNGRDQRAA